LIFFAYIKDIFISYAVGRVGSGPANGHELCTGAIKYLERAKTKKILLLVMSLCQFAGPDPKRVTVAGSTFFAAAQGIFGLGEGVWLGVRGRATPTSRLSK